MDPAQDLSTFLHIKQGSCYPDWASITTFIEENVPQPEWSQTWEAVSRTWVGRIGGQLGGDYRLYETASFLVLCPAPIHVVKHLCRAYEDALKRLQTALQGIGSFEGFGKQVVLMFEGLDDYYEYISYFYPDGEHPMSGGVCLSSSGYIHFAFPMTDHALSSTVLVHELTHGSLEHLPLPVWINEAMAMRMEHSICGHSAFHFDQDIHDRHLAHWNSDTIQEFWSGRSWDIQGDSFELSYNLAYMIWWKIEGRLKPPAIRDLLTNVNREDAGQSASQSALNISLGRLAAEFLGEGDWEPQPARWSTLLLDSAPT